jgi:aminopeptidase
MHDPRIDKLADILVTYSCRVQPGENVLIEGYDIPDEAITAVVARVHAAGGRPFVTVKRNAVLRALYNAATEEQMELTGGFEADRMSQMQAYIGLRGAQNSSEMSDVPDDKMKLYRKLWWNRAHSEIRVKRTKWVVLRWPTPSMAQEAGRSTEAFENFYFDVCTFDYAKMADAVRPLKELMERTDRVHLTAPGTDLRFSIKDIPVIPCTGEFNIPDGECFSAPVRDSVEGRITFNAATNYGGKTFEGVSLTFKSGKIVQATAAGGMTSDLNAILDSDEGARYVGEFSLGFNPFILQPMKDILFDEKIAGSLHFTPGGAYENADNGNRSMVHWDLVLMQRAEQGGGEIVFDDRVIRKDGVFVVPELEGLNPEKLKGL